MVRGHRRARPVRAVFAVGALTLGLVALGSTAALAASVSAVDFRFQPQTVTITAGESVTWTNNGQSPHTATGSGFNSGNLNPGQSYSHTFNTAGTFAYHCIYHESQGMVGTVVVTGGGGSTPPTTPTGSGTSLPNTGIGSGSLLVVAVGIGLLLMGAALLVVRRRRA
jgi:LPXTG-motif cell wall-anchored protein